MLKFGIVGIGRMGGRHAVNIAKGRVKGAELTAVCDTDGAKLAAFKKKFPRTEVFVDYVEMFSSAGLDAVIVATPHYAHVTIVKAALASGINVLSEKPQAVTIGEAREAAAFADLYPDLKYGIMYNQRTNKMYKFARDILEKGELGGLKRVSLTVTDWYRSQSYYDQGGWRASWRGEGGGILINQCVHQLDILQWLVGMPVSVSAAVATVGRNITVENDVAALFEYNNGAKGVFTASGHELHGTDRFEIAGEKGKLVLDKYKTVYYKFEKSEPEVNASAKGGSYGSVRASKKIVRYGLFRLLFDLVLGQQLRIIRNFAQAIKGEEALIADGREGVNALSLINAIYLSSYGKGGAAIEIPLDADEYDLLLEKLKNNEPEKK